MKVNLNTVVCNLGGTPYQTETGEEATAKYFIIKAFDNMTESDAQLTLEQKLDMYDLAMKITKTKATIELSDDDVSVIMTRVSMFSIPAIGAISGLLKSK